MKTTEPVQIDGVEKQHPPAKFIPVGAMAFFTLLVLLCLAIWFGIYFLMIERA